MSANPALVQATACAILDQLNAGEVTPLDLLDALEARIAEVDGKVNALPTLCFDRARTHAKTLMKKPVGERGLLAGMPVPIKDLFNVEGVLSTQGSPIFKDNVPTRSDLVVEHLEANGALFTPNPTRRNLAPAPIPSTRCSARPSIRGTPRDPRPVPREARLSRSRPAWRGSHMAPTWAARCAIPPASAASSGCGPASAVWRIRWSPRSTATSPSMARWRAMSRTSRCCSTP